MTRGEAEHEYRSGKRRVLCGFIENLKESGHSLLDDYRNYGQEMLELDLKCRDMILDSIFSILADLDEPLDDESVV